MGGVDVVVLGGSIAGCCAAAALAGPGRRILLLERDVLPGKPQQRQGVPQSGQPHVFLLRGLREAEALVPGLAERLRACGAVPLDTGRLSWLSEWGWLPQGPPIEILSLTRPLLEHEFRTATLALPGVRLRDGADVRGLTRRGGRWVVRLADRSDVEADVVIDAMGRSSRLATWLQQAGLATPRVSGIDARLGYATRVYAGARPHLPGIVVPINKSTLRGGLALPVEGDRWLIAAIGCGELRPSRDVAGHLAALESLGDPAIAELARTLEPCGDVEVHRRTDNRRLHYERLSGLPPGLLVVGDALCSFNPVYGQGITVASMQGGVLRSHVAALTGSKPLHRLQRRLAACTRLPWLVAAGADAAYPTSSGEATASQRLVDGWGRRLMAAAAAGDATALEALSEAYHLIAPPSALIRPRVVVAGLRGGSGKPVLRPALLDSLGA
jgi:2-polyprenyl-6-methoxyphenol hydroxylase-like FAD-dependent oxidoreductase